MAAGEVLQRQVRTIFEAVGRMGADPRDSDSLRLSKRIMASAGIFGGVPANLAMTVLALLAAETVAAAISLAAAAIMTVTFAAVYAGRLSFGTSVIINLSVTLLSSFFLALALGGLTNSAFVLIWGLVPPMLAILYYDTRHAVLWLLAFLLAILICLLLQPYLRTANNFSPFAINMLAAVNMSGISLLAFAAFVLFIKQRDLAYRFLALEQAKSEKLLLNILPLEVAQTLKNSDGIVADYYAGASILFADVVNFTPLSAGMPPEALVALLNEVFTYFDGLVDKYELEKIKTIGDCYMVASGLPRRRADHAAVLVRMALEMRDHVASHAFAGRQLAFRIGINSGPVVAGVIGRRKFIYDLWGDAVNTASRMESNGHSGDIQITEATYDLIKDSFNCEAQGLVQVKGKGAMAVWFVRAEKS